MSNNGNSLFPTRHQPIIVSKNLCGNFISQFENADIIAHIFGFAEFNRLKLNQRLKNFFHNNSSIANALNLRNAKTAKSFPFFAQPIMLQVILFSVL